MACGAAAFTMGLVDHPLSMYLRSLPPGPSHGTYVVFRLWGFFVPIIFLGVLGSGTPAYSNIFANLSNAKVFVLFVLLSDKLLYRHCYHLDRSFLFFLVLNRRVSGI